MAVGPFSTYVFPSSSVCLSIHWKEGDKYYHIGELSDHIPFRIFCSIEKPYSSKSVSYEEFDELEKKGKLCKKCLRSRKIEFEDIYLESKKAQEVFCIDELFPIEYQRTYIDEFKSGKRTHVGSRRILRAWYGHCGNYPKGFMVVLERKVDSYARYREIAKRM